jgi:hypothetical protein
MSFYEDGRRRAVTIRGPQAATQIGRYNRDVRTYLEGPTRDPSILRKWEGRTFVDAYGKRHVFETDPAKILSAVERAESETGAFDIYPEGGEDEAAFVGAEA